VTDVGPLGAGATTTVSFTSVNLEDGCHEFTVTADCDSNVSESNENNNATSEWYQVDNVIVVHNNSDLISEADRNVGGTYYIENRTITNCAGCGITIENTTLPFVIQNCTVHDCAYKGSTGDSAGICLDNVTKGTIGDPSNTNTIANNTDAGIRVKNSTYVDITDNTIRNNTRYGIYAYPRTLPVTSETRDDCKYINVTNNTVTENVEAIDLIAYNCTVKNNTVTDNTRYGIYMMGNYSNITNNVIQDNTDYGVKLYNSSDIYIYENVFIDNNASNSGHQACDNRNSNDWNITDIGNYWSDLKDNPNFPDNYSIDCDSNIDYHPKKLYDFSTRTPGTNAWAFKNQVNAKPPNTCDVPNTEFSSTDYAKIKVDDGTYQDASSLTQYAAHRFNFSIDEDAANITAINVTWNGRGYKAGGDGATLYIWNGTGYEELANNTVGTDATLTGGVTSSISSYINSGNVTVLVEQNANGPTSRIKTDYVKLVVTP